MLGTNKILIYLIIATCMCLYGCDGGSGGGGGQVSSSNSNRSESPPILVKKYYSPGQYASVDNCAPFLGDSSAPLKIFFVEIDNPKYFDEIVDDAITLSFQQFPPFNNYLSQTAFYKINITGQAALGCDGSSVECNSEKIDAAIAQQCTISKLDGIIKVVIHSNPYKATGGEIIYVGSDPNHSEIITRGLKENVILHEVAHNFGLADLYGGGIWFDGSPSQTWPTDMSRSFLNSDGPGCSKWCNAYKPANEYTQDPMSVCLTLNSKQSCVTHNRFSDGNCPADAEGNFQCCVWSDTPFEYFDSNCVPHRGVENIGLDCFEDTGCYFGSVYGHYTWRPVEKSAGSVMWSTESTKFSAVGRRELENVFRCCLTGGDASSSCAVFRDGYSDFLIDINFKERIGSCGGYLE